MDAQRCLTLSYDYFHPSQQGRWSGAQAWQDCPPAPICRIICSFGAACARPEGFQQKRSMAVTNVLPHRAAWERWCLLHQPCSTYAPCPEQLATILGSLICCDLSRQNICLKKDQIFIAHLCILLKGEMRLVMVDKYKSMCRGKYIRGKERKRKEGGERAFFLTCSIYSFLLLPSSFLCSVFWCWEFNGYDHAIQSSPANPVLPLDVVGLYFVSFVEF